MQPGAVRTSGGLHEPKNNATMNKNRLLPHRFTLPVLFLAVFRWRLRRLRNALNDDE